MVILYQYLISKIKKLPYFVVLLLSLGVILIFDAFVFNVALFYGTPIFKTSLLGHVIGKSIAATFYSAILFLYLKYLDDQKESTSFIANQERDIFSIIKYRKRYEDLKIEKKRVEKRLTSQLETSLQNISDGFVSLDNNWRYTFINKKAAEFLGKSPESLIGKNMWTEFPEGVNHSFYKVYHDALETQKTIYFEDYYEPMDKWFENRIYPSPDGLTIYFTDITEQKKSQLAVKESENRIKTILETEPECVKQLNQKGELLYMNPAGLEMIEADNLDMVKGKSVIKLINSDYRLAFKNQIDDVFQGNSSKLIFKLTGFKGKERWMETHAVPFKDTDGNINSLLGITRDITDRKMAEEQIIQSEKRFRGLTSNAPVAIFQTDNHGACNYVNEEWVKYAGMSFEEAMGFGWVNAIHPDDRAWVVKEWEQTVNTGNEFNAEFRFQNKENKITWLSVKVAGIQDDDNNLYSYIGMALDITKLKNAEEQLVASKNYIDNIINNIGDPVFVKDDESSFLIANTAFYKLFNRTEKQIIGRTFADDVPQEERIRYLEIDNKVLNEGVENIDEECIEVNGETRYISTKKTRFIDSYGNKFLVGVIRDITNLKKAEKQVIESREYLNNMLNNIGDPVFVKDHESKLILVNNAFCEIFDLSSEEALGKTLGENVPDEEKESFLSVDKQVLSTGIENVNEESLTIKGKETKIISTKKTRYIDRNGNKFIIGTIRDITERKKAEKEILQLGNRNTQIIQTLLDGFILADTSGNIVDVNPSYVKMIGFDLKELLTMNINQLEVALNQSEIDERIKEMVRKGFARFNSNHKKKNGEIIDLDVSTFTMQINEQHLVAAFVKDITERKKAEIELEKHRNHLEDLVEKRTAEVNTKNAELQRMNKLFVGRELKMKELKGVIKDLQEKNDN
jgi:PAS domain S-box-containing protein